MQSTFPIHELCSQVSLDLLHFRVGLAEAFLKAATKDEKICHRDEQCKGHTRKERHALVRIEHVKACPQIESIHPCAKEALGRT